MSGWINTRRMARTGVPYGDLSAGGRKSTVLAQWIEWLGGQRWSATFFYRPSEGPDAWFVELFDETGALLGQSVGGHSKIEAALADAIKRVLSEVGDVPPPGPPNTLVHTISPFPTRGQKK